MKKILAFTGSPRPRGNSTILLEHFIKGAKQNTDLYEIIDPYKIKIKYCAGCLRCNIIKKCSIKDDQWRGLSESILNSDIIVIASPIYFHHLTASLKKIIDRFRSFVNVRITETGLIHTPWQEWKKDFVLILSMGSPDDIEAKQVVELFEYITEILGSENKLHVIKATRVAMAKQIEKTSEELNSLYKKLKIPSFLSENDNITNKQVIKNCFELGEKLTTRN